MKKILILLLIGVVFVAQSQTYTGDYFKARQGVTSAGTITATGLFKALNFKTDSTSVRIGNEVGYAKSLSSNSIFIGDSAGYQNQSSSTEIVAIGYNAGKNIQGMAVDNVFIGWSAGKSVTNKYDNTIVGAQAGMNSNGLNNTFIGTVSGYQTTGDNNTFLGENAGYANTSGGDNVYIGRTSGYNNSTGSGGVYIGYASGLNTVKSNRFVVNNTNAGSAANDSTKSLLWGMFNNADLTQQYLRVNGSFYAGLSAAANYVEIEPDGTIELHGTATVFDDLFFPFSTGQVGFTGYPTFNKDSLYFEWGVDTVGSDAQYMYFVIQLPHSWKEGSTIYPHVHYKHETTPGTPTFQMKYKWYNIGATTNQAWKYYPMSTTTGTTNNTHQMVAGAGLSGSGKTISSILVCYVYLKSQTGTGAIKAWQMDIHIEKDGLGSRTTTAK